MMAKTLQEILQPKFVRRAIEQYCCREKYFQKRLSRFFSYESIDDQVDDPIIVEIKNEQVR